MPIEVIVAGLPRSGTTSLLEALERLGFTKTMHMSSCMENPLLSTAWKEIYENHLEKSWTNDDWRYMFDKQFPEYVATTLPASDFAVELARAYPEAKVILLYRNPDTWFPSFQPIAANLKDLYWRSFVMWPLKNLRPFYQFRKHRLTWWRDIYNHSDIDKEFMPFYLNKIKTAVAAERILEYKIQDGWAPLCKFLNKEVPVEDFPHKNKFQDLQNKRNNGTEKALAIWVKWLTQAAMVAVILVISALLCWRGVFFFDKISSF